MQQIINLKISSVNINWLNIYVNKNETIKNQNENKRRPRITFNMLKKQLDKNKIKLKTIFNNNIKYL